MNPCCNAPQTGESTPEYEVLKIRQTKSVCKNCEEYVSRNATKQVAIVSCEGACLRGEISRRTADAICFDLLPERTVRICQGSAVTKNGGQRRLVLNAERLLVLEGCSVQCATRLIESLGRTKETETICTDGLIEFDRSLFARTELPGDEIERLAASAAVAVVKARLRV